MTGRVVDFIKTGIWQIETDSLPRPKAFVVTSLRVLLNAIHGFINHRATSHAAILTYYSVLNIVPLIAVIFAIAKGFGLDRVVGDYILKIGDSADLQLDVTEQLLQFAQKFLEQAKGGVIAGFGVVLLFWTILSILGKIEEALNTIWGVKKERVLLRKFTDYMAILVVAPVLFAISNSLTVLVAGEVGIVVQKIRLLGVFSHMITFLLKFLPFVSLWALLTMLYVIMPNTKIPLRSAIAGSIIAGTLVQIVQWIYITFQIGVASHGAIYGSLAALPLLFGWIQTSWMIILFGFEIVRASEHHKTYGFTPDYDKISLSSRKVIVLAVFSVIARRFSAGERPLSACEISDTLKVPLALVQELLENMARAHLVAEVADGETHGGFQPARSIEGFTLEDVLDVYDGAGALLPACQSDDIIRMSDHLKRFYDTVRNLPENTEISKL